MRHPRKIHGSFQTFGNTNPCPEAPARSNTFANVEEAKSTFRNEAVDSGHDYILADGYGGGGACWMDLYDSEAWDGVSYGDPYAWLEFKTSRLGIHVESF